MDGEGVIAGLWSAPRIIVERVHVLLLTGTNFILHSNSMLVRPQITANVMKAPSERTVISPLIPNWNSICSSRYTMLESFPVCVWPDQGEYYSEKDVYGDYHPVFNASDVASIRISLTEENMKDMLTPSRIGVQVSFLGIRLTFPQEYYTSNFTFHNNRIHDHVTDVGFKIKGLVQSRIGIKKAYNIKFNMIVGNKYDIISRISLIPDRWQGLKKLQLKRAEDAARMSDMLVATMNRAAMVQTYRGSYAALYVNDIYFGLYWMHESFDDIFLESRYATHFILS